MGSFLDASVPGFHLLVKSREDLSLSLSLWGLLPFMSPSRWHYLFSLPFFPFLSCSPLCPGNKLIFKKFLHLYWKAAKFQWMCPTLGVLKNYSWTTNISVFQSNNSSLKENDELPRGSCLEKFLLHTSSKFYVFSFTEPALLLASRRREGTSNLETVANYIPKRTIFTHPGFFLSSNLKLHSSNSQ